MARQERVFRTRAVDLARQLPIVKDLDALDAQVGPAARSLLACCSCHMSMPARQYLRLPVGGRSPRRTAPWLWWAMR
jgi:hypothetical protein